MKLSFSKSHFLFIFLFISFVLVSCKEETTTPDNNLEKNSLETEKQQASKKDANTEKQENTKVRFAEENEATSPNSPEGNTAPIALVCDYFVKNPNTILKDNPEAPVDFTIDCFIRVDDKLRIEPGVVIAFDQGAGIYFKEKSSFNLEGTAEKPIVLTGKEETKGYWRGIHSKSSHQNNAMRYVQLQYAGNDAKAGLEINRENSNLTLEHCTFSENKNYGMVVNDDVGKDVNNISIKNCTFTKNDIPFKTHVSRLRMFDGSNNFSGNTKDYIYLDGGILRGDATWVKLDVPYFLQDNFKNNEGVLTVEPGTEIIMPAQSWMHLSKKASLVMVGTQENPIVIRGEHDVAGFWEGLTIDSGSPLNEIAHVNFKNAGSTTGNPNGVVRLERSKFLKIHDVVFTNCFEYGVSLQSAAKSHLEYSNLKLENTPKLFSDWKGEEIIEPENL